MQKNVFTEAASCENLDDAASAINHYKGYLGRQARQAPWKPTRLTSDGTSLCCELKACSNSLLSDSVEVLLSLMLVQHQSH
ncbi:hypothetical protein ACS0TY_014607 [Phlomoides rotata]